MRGSILAVLYATDIFANFLKFSRDELDELFSDAVREEQIERKLSLLEEQWSSETLTLGDHKGRAACILKVRCMWNAMVCMHAC